MSKATVAPLAVNQKATRRVDAPGASYNGLTVNGVHVMVEVCVAEMLADALQRLPNHGTFRDEEQEELVHDAILDRLTAMLTRLPDAVRKLDAAVA